MTVTIEQLTINFGNDVILLGGLLLNHCDLVT